MLPYRDSLVPPFTIRKSHFWEQRKMQVSQRDSGPYPTLREAHQVFLRRQREEGNYWVEDEHGHVVDFDRLNREGKSSA